MLRSNTLNHGTQRPVMHHRVKDNWRALALLVLSALVLAACNTGGSTPSADPAPAAATAAPADEPEPTPNATTNATTDATQEASGATDADAAEEPVTTAQPSAEAVITPTAVITPDAATTPVANGTAVLTPLVVDETPSECEIESNLDLAGYLDIEARMGCALAPAKFDPVAINEFGTGPDYDRFMLWFGAEGNIYVLLPDGTYTVHPDEWQEGDATFTCNPLEGDPESPPLPRRGFGKVWCEQPDLQEIMGTIEREERLCQHAVDQPFERGRLIACFEDASVRYFRLLNDNTWDVTTQ